MLNDDPLAKLIRHLSVALIMLIFLIGFQLTAVTYAQTPKLGAEVWIEPGQSDQEIDHWFELLSENNMPVARLFIMWDYIEPQKGRWDFSLYDKAFDAAEKYGVGIVATLTANRRSIARGDWYQLHGHKLEQTQKRLNESKIYISHVVEHYKDNPALDSWILTNEAGQRPTPYPLALKKFRKWLQNKYQTIGQLNNAWTTNFANFDSVKYAKPWSTSNGYWYWVTPYVDWHIFWREYLGWWLNWIKTDVRKIDSNHPIQAQIGSSGLGNLANSSLDISSWTKFADILGASIHPSWAFGSLNRDQFALGVSYICDLLRGSSEPKPFWVTELQGGTNIHSGGAYPLTPTTNDIAQWTWTSIGSGAQRVIYWLLNNRMQGREAGEWSMLDYQNRPSERLITAGDIAKTIFKNSDFFQDAVPIKSNLTILLSLKTMTLQAWNARDDYPGRGPNAHVFSILAYYEALQELGIPVRIKFMEDYDWDKNYSSPQLAILPDITSLSQNDAKNIKRFVKHGNSALITGLTGIYGPDATFWPLKNYPLENMLGANLKEIKLVNTYSKISLFDPQLSLPFHLWRAEINNKSAKIIGKEQGRTVAIRNKYGNGKVVWIPSMLGLGAWHKDNTALAQLLSDVTKSFTQNLPFRFQTQQHGFVMRVLQKGEEFVTIITNGTNKSKEFDLEVQQRALNAKILWGRKAAVRDNGRAVSLQSRETVVIDWTE